jgi:clan AA aspartic protease
MGLTDVKMGVANPASPRRRAVVKFLVDSGAAYTVLPQKVWKRLGLKPLETLEFDLADGTSVAREISEARFAFQGKQRTSPVVLGVGDDMPLLGVVTLETMGLVLNPLKRELVPIRAVLAHVR